MEVRIIAEIQKLRELGTEPVSLFDGSTEETALPSEFASGDSSINEASTSDPLRSGEITQNSSEILETQVVSLGIQRPSGRSHLTWVRTRTRHVLIGRNEPWSEVVVIHWLLISHLYKGMYFSSITFLRQFGKLSHLTPTTSGKCPSHDILHNSYGTAEQTFFAVGKDNKYSYFTILRC